MSFQSYIKNDKRISHVEVFNTAATVVANGGTNTDVVVDNGIGTFNGTTSKIVYKTREVDTAKGISYYLRNFNISNWGYPTAVDYIFSHITDTNTYVWVYRGTTNFNIVLSSSAGNYRTVTFDFLELRAAKNVTITIDASLDVAVFANEIELSATSDVVTGTPVGFKVNKLLLGAKPNLTAGFTAELNIFEIFKDTILTEDEVTALHNNRLYRTPSMGNSQGDGLWVQCNGIIADRFGNSYTITNVEIKHKGSNDIMRFNAVNSVLSINHPIGLNNVFYDGGATWSAWIYPYSDGRFNLGNIIDKTVTNFRLGNEAAGSNKIIFKRMFTGTDGEWRTTNTVVPNGKWSLVEVIYEARDVANVPIIRLNGITTAIDTITTPTGSIMTDAGHDLKIGGTAANHAFDGYIDECKIIKTMRSAEDSIREFRSTVNNYR